MSPNWRGGMFSAVAVLSLIGLSETSLGQQAESTAVIAVADLGAEDWMPHLDAGSQRTVYDLVNETLIGLDAKRNPVPRLAKSWEVSEDGKTWRFKLQEGVQFHDGYGEMTAEDVKFTWAMYTREDSLQTRVGQWRSAVSGDVEKNFEIVDKYEFVLHGDKPNLLLPLSITYHNTTPQIQSKAYWEKVGEAEARKRPIGTGPYRFESQTAGLEVVLRAVDNHWRRTPTVDRLVIKVVADEAARLAQVRAGEVDIAQVKPSVATEATAVGVNVVFAENAYQCNVHFGGIYPYEKDEKGFTGINKPDLPWTQNDRPERGFAVRKAMSLAIDRKLIASALLSDMAKPARAPMQLAYITDPTFEPEAFDLEQAKRLLAEGGYPEGFVIDMPIYEQSGRGASVDVAHAVAGMWEELGLTVNRLPMEYEPTFRAHMEQRTTGDPWPGSNGVAKVYIFCQNFDDEPASQLQSSIRPGSAFAHFHHAVAEEMLPAIVRTVDRDKRIELQAELGRKLAEDYVSFGVVAAVAPSILSDRIAGWPLLPGRGEYNNLEYIELKQ